MSTKSNLLAKELAKECRSVEDVQEHLKNLFRDTIQEIFEAEMDEHLGYNKLHHLVIIQVTVETVITEKQLRQSTEKQP